MDTHQIILLTIVLTVIGVTILRLIIATLLCGGDMRRLKIAVRGSWRILRQPVFADQVANLLDPPPPPPPPKPSGAPLRLLTLLQRDGRLLDFLLEDIQGYGDDQIGAAVRDIHRNCQKALQEHLVLAPVLNQSEGATVEVPVGFDPSAIRLTGNVTGQPPFRGTLQHHGWRVQEIKLATPPEGVDEFVVHPAEVDLP